MYEVADDIGEEGVGGDDLLGGASQGGLEGVYVVGAEALGQLDYAPDAVFDLHEIFIYVLHICNMLRIIIIVCHLHERFHFRHVFHFLRAFSLVGGPVCQATYYHTRHEHVNALFVVALAVFGERFVEFGERQVPHFLFAIEHALALSYESYVSAVTSD